MFASYYLVPEEEVLLRNRVISRGSKLKSWEYQILFLFPPNCDDHLLIVMTSNSLPCHQLDQITEAGLFFSFL